MFIAARQGIVGICATVELLKCIVLLHCGLLCLINSNLFYVSYHSHVPLSEMSAACSIFFVFTSLFAYVYICTSTFSMSMSLSRPRMVFRFTCDKQQLCGHWITTRVRCIWSWKYHMHLISVVQVVNCTGLTQITNFFRYFSVLRCFIPSVKTQNSPNVWLAEDLDMYECDYCTSHYVFVFSSQCCMLGFEPCYSFFRLVHPASWNNSHAKHYFTTSILTQKMSQIMLGIFLIPFRQHV